MVDPIIYDGFYCDKENLLHYVKTNNKMDPFNGKPFDKKKI